MRTLTTLALAAFGALLTACGSTGTGPLDAPLDPAALERALDAELFGGGALDLSASLRDGRPVALVFWQAW